MRYALWLILLFTLAGCGSGENSDSGNPYAASFAGFYYGSSQSDIYHYPSCPSANQINQVNLVSFSSANVAVTAGYRPCLICVPPLGVFINNPPLIVLSEQSKTQLNVNTGFVYVSVRVVASDETRDIKYLSCSSYDPSGHLVDSKDLDVSEYMPSTVDTRWSVKIDTSKIGVHTIKADAYDSRNQKAIASAYVVVQ